MKFTSGGIGRKNGYRFEIKYSSWLDGEELADKWYLYCSRPTAASIYNEGTYTQRSLRFPTQEAAQDYCEKIAAGEVTLAQLKAAEDKAWAEYGAKRHAKAEQKVDAFLTRMHELGVNPVLVPDILKAYNDMNNTLDGRFKTILDERLAALKESSVAYEASTNQSLGNYLDTIYRNDIDVCLVDQDTAEHDLPAICYLTQEDLDSGDYEYEPWEKWILSLPLSHIVDWHGCPLAVVTTQFTADQTAFLLEEGEYVTKEWHNLNLRATWAGADFDARLTYLTEQRAFETPFDANCMDAQSPDARTALCEMLKSSANVFVTTYPNNAAEFYAYSYDFPPKGPPTFSWDEVSIKHTAPGRGLIQTLDGKVAWATHLSKKAHSELTPQRTPDRAEKEMESNL